ncbi:MAG TPA: hypothetical protein VGC40_06990 [Paenirhodobacter sp.]
MKTYMIAAASIWAGLTLASAAQAGPVGNACMNARNATNAVCGCIDQVADQSLSRSDQRRAAGFFKDPDKAQQVRMSERQSDNDFWLRYKNFATTAEAYCAR